MKSYTEMTNKGIYIGISLLMIIYGLFLITSFSWLNTYHGGNMQLVSETSIYLKMLNLNNYILISIPLVAITSCGFMIATSIGITRKLFIRCYGKIEFFKVTLIQNIIFAMLASGLMFAAYMISIVGNSLLGSELSSLFMPIVNLGVVGYSLIGCSFIAIQIIITYFILAVKDHIRNNLNKYKSPAL